MLLLLYVDDMIVAGDDVQQGVAEIKQRLQASFEMQDLGRKASYFLGIEVDCCSAYFSPRPSMSLRY